MKVSLAVLFGAGLLVTGMTAGTASAQQDAYASAGRTYDQGDARSQVVYGAETPYGRYGERYAGHVGAPVYGTTPDYGDSRFAQRSGYDDSRYSQRDDGRRYDQGGPNDNGRQSNDPGGYGDQGQGYAQSQYGDERQYAQRRDDGGGYDQGDQGGYDSRYAGGDQGGGYAEPERYYGDHHGYHQRDGYRSDRGYGETYHAHHYVDRYAGFVAPPPIDNSDLEQLRAYCGCSSYGDGY